MADEKQVFGIVAVYVTENVFVLALTTKDELAKTL